MKKPLLFLFIVIVVAILVVNRASKKDVILTDKAPSPIGPYSQAIRAHKTLFVSGQIALKPDGGMDTLSIESECHRVLENIRQILNAGDRAMSDVVKATIYTTDLKQFGRINDVYKTYFPSDPPARETVEVKALPKGAHVEISVIAE